MFFYDNKTNIIGILSGDYTQKSLHTASFKNFLVDQTIAKSLRNIIRFYVAYGGAKRNEPGDLFIHKELYVPDECKIEDVGLSDLALTQNLRHSQ